MSQLTTRQRVWNSVKAALVAEAYFKKVTRARFPTNSESPFCTMTKGIVVHEKRPSVGNVRETMELYLTAGALTAGRDPDDIATEMDAMTAHVLHAMEVGIFPLLVQNHVAGCKVTTIEDADDVVDELLDYADVVFHFRLEYERVQGG